MRHRCGLPCKLTGAAVVLAVAGLLSGCLDDIQPRQQINELRIIGVRLDPPDAKPGDTVTATALVVSPLGRDDYAVDWFVCEAPVAAADYFSGVFDPSRGFCADPDHPDGTPFGQGLSMTFQVPDDFLGQAKDLLLAEDFVDDDGSLDGLLAFIGWHMRVKVVATLTGPDGDGLSDSPDSVEAHKRLLVTTLGGRNTNPDPPVLYVQHLPRGEPHPPPPDHGDLPPPGECFSPTSADLVFHQSENYALVPVNLPTEYQEFVQLDFLGQPTTLNEEYWFSWFSTTRGMRVPVTKNEEPVVLWTTRTPKDSDLYTDGAGDPVIPIWVVVRDGRGGTSWCHQQVPYVPTE